VVTVLIGLVEIQAVWAVLDKESLMNSAIENALNEFPADRWMLEQAIRRTLVIYLKL
jgi:hypothetical protein